MPLEVSAATKLSSLYLSTKDGVRFAPSPTGRFHVGNLRTAWISYIWARELNLPWVIRFEDIDRPRVVAGAEELQLADLAALGMVPSVHYKQSHLRVRHWTLFARAVQCGAAYACTCSRKDVQEALSGLASAPHDGPAVYSGHCRDLDFKQDANHKDSVAWRFRMPDPTGQDDFIIARTHGSKIAQDHLKSSPSITDFSQTTPIDQIPESYVPSYHWACAVDDFDSQCCLLVRASDLRSAAESQRAIQKWLGKQSATGEAVPAIFHTSLVVKDDGQRLEKRTQGVTLPEINDPDALLYLFDLSFDRKLLHSKLSEGALLGEKRDTLTLYELGLTL